MLDVDLPDGFASLRSIETREASLGRSLVARTGSGGVHLFLAHPGEGFAIANRAGSVLGPDLDVRGDGGYVIAPPSRHVLGGTYRWRMEGPPQAMPGWLVETLAPRRCAEPPQLSPRTLVRGGTGASAWAAVALDRETEAVRRAPEGLRNHTLNRAAFVLGQIVGGGHLARDHVASLLAQAGEDVGLASLEIGRTITSGLTAGMRSPRHPPARLDLRTVTLDTPVRPTERVSSIER